MAGVGEDMDAAFYLRLGFGAEKVQAVERSRTHEEVHVRIIEGGDDRVSARFDDAGVATDQGADVRVRAHRRDAFAFDRHCCRAWPARGPDLASHHHQ